MTEIEVKFKTDGFDDIKKKLKEAGFRQEWDSLETVAIYDMPGNELNGKGITVRIKDIGGKTVFTVKQKIEGKFKSAIEKECVVDSSLADFQEMLEIIGFTRVLEYSKNRTHYSRGEYSVELDHIEEIGEKFIELEATSEEKLDKLIAELGLRGLEPDTRSYTKIIREHRGK
jgi:predicted adenylyl cyclase CyaB